MLINLINKVNLKRNLNKNSLLILQIINSNLSF